jgi:hypothetical protein
VDEVDLPAYDTLVKFNDSGQIVGDLANDLVRDKTSGA